MIRIGILTFHKSINYGAFMQAYSLSTRIKNDFPECDVDIIDYVPLRTIEDHNTALSRKIINWNTPNRMKVAQVKSFLQNPRFREQRKNRMLAFMHDWNALPLSEKKYYTDNYKDTLDELKNLYDIIVVGSDCVWEFIVDGFPNVYFLNNSDIKHKFSYAASSDRIHISDLDDSTIQYINESLSGFDYLGIRDISTQNLIHSINPNLPLNHNCDPTVLLDLEKCYSNIDRVVEILKRRNINVSKPIIGIMGDDNIGRLVRDLFHNEYPVVCVYSNTRYADVYLDDLTPFEWAHVFSLFSIVFTRYFHGTILSLKNGTPTITLDPWKMKSEEHTTKIKDLYNRLGLQGHYYIREKSYLDETKEEIKRNAIRFMKDPDREEIKAALEKESKSYLSFYNQLKNCVREIEG